MTSQLGRTRRPPRQASRAVRRGEQKKKWERVMSDERALRTSPLMQVPCRPSLLKMESNVGIYFWGPPTGKMNNGGGEVSAKCEGWDGANITARSGRPSRREQRFRRSGNTKQALPRDSRRRVRDGGAVVVLIIPRTAFRPLLLLSWQSMATLNNCRPASWLASCDWGWGNLRSEGNHLRVRFHEPSRTDL